MSRHLVGEWLQPVADLNLTLLIAVVEQDQRMTSIGIFESSIGYPCLLRLGGGDTHSTRLHHGREMTNDVIVRVAGDGLIV